MTEGIKYAGSKLKLLPHILDVCSDLPVTTVLDGFSGTTRVSQALAKSGYSVISNDISDWSEVFAKCYLLNSRHESSYKELFDHLNNLPPEDGWFTDNYGGYPGTDCKKPFQIKNTRKLDAIRREIDDLGLNDIEKSVALSGLILALDTVDNTMGHYVSYLSKWSQRSYKDLYLKVPCLFSCERDHKVIKEDILSVVERERADLSYFDPPYGSNNVKMPASRVRYSSYYHIWTTVVRNDKPSLFGKANRREDSRDLSGTSVFEEFRSDQDGIPLVLNDLHRLVRGANSRYVLLSYSSGGRVSKRLIEDMLSSCGNLKKVQEIDYSRNVMSEMRWSNQWTSDNGKHKEYLFLLEKVK